jgi:hypothetical protein
MVVACIFLSAHQAWLIPSSGTSADHGYTCFLMLLFQELTLLDLMTRPKIGNSQTRADPDVRVIKTVAGPARPILGNPMFAIFHYVICVLHSITTD